MAPSPNRQINHVPPVAGVKRPAASLLPAFEPLSSSPALPRVHKRARESPPEESTYPTPVPTSSTLMPTSSPSAETVSRVLTRGQLTSERAPLADVPMIELPRDGKMILMGRSSATCHHQLSSNRLISRVHVTAAYKPARDHTSQDQIEITCKGWNGIKIRCRGSVLEINKGQTFSSCHKDLDVMVDVQDSRVCVKWPAKNDDGFTSASSDDEDDEISPTRGPRLLQRHSTPASPILLRNRMISPISPSPAIQAMSIPSSPPNLLQPSGAPIIIYEDEPESPRNPDSHESLTASHLTQRLSESAVEPGQSQEAVHNEHQDFSDPDEENDPIIHSFGAAGANLLPRMASVVAGDSQKSPVRKELRSQMQPPKTSISPAKLRNRSGSFDLKTHVINQLAFSRLSSTPLSTIISHFPEHVGDVSSDSVREMISQARCIGEVPREGKDAAGKALESEFYYMADEDEDEMRREAVVHDLRKPGLRSCRKQHKQYFWRKPK